MIEPVTEGPGYGTRAVGMLGCRRWTALEEDSVRPGKWDWRDGDLLRSLGPESPVLDSRIRSTEALASTKEDRVADEMI